MTERLKGLGLPAAEHCIVVSIDQQKLWFISGHDCETYVVSTARAGRGCVQDSLQTPDGLHRVAEKIGDGAAPGQDVADEESGLTIDACGPMTASSSGTVR